MWCEGTGSGYVLAMTEPTEQDIPAEPHDGLDAFKQPGTRRRPRTGSSRCRGRRAKVRRPPTRPPENTAPTVEGTGAGDALAGVRIDDEDAAHAVDPEDGSAASGR